MKNLFEKYNKNNSLVVISSFPKKQEVYSQGVCAVASFTKNTLNSLKKSRNYKRIVVLTMIIDKEEIYEEDGMLIVRCFRRNQPLSYLNILKQLRHVNNIKKVLIEFEFASFGDSRSTLAILPLTWALFAMKKNVTLVIHQVVLDLQKLSGHIGISSNFILNSIFNPALKLYYKLLSLPVSLIIVLEDNLKKRLSRVVDEDKIAVIPHGVPKVRKVSQSIARKKLGLTDEHVILYFGYLTWYKGVDFLIRSFLNKKSYKGKKIKLIIAGGASFTQEKKPHYQKFIMSIQALLRSLPSHIQITGFVDEKDIPLYFEASDLIVFPYRAFISSSGPLSFTLAYKKPFVISDNLKKLIESDDVIKSMHQAGIEKNDLIFSYNQKDLIKHVGRSLDNKTNEKLKKFSTLLSRKRSFDVLSERYAQVLDRENTSSKNAFTFPKLNFRFHV